MHEGKTPPRKCPDCGSAGTWEKVEYVDDWDDEGGLKDDYEDQDDA